MDIEDDIGLKVLRTLAGKGMSLRGHRMSDKARIHFLYTIGILIAIIVVLTTVKWAGIPNLLGYITFALTVSSLLLAVLAIGYAFISNNSLSQYLGQFSGVAAEISKSAAEVFSTTQILDKKIEAIPLILKDVGERVERTESLLQEISRKEPSGEPPPRSLDLDALARRFLETTSISADLFLYALLLSFQRATPFKLSDLISTVRSLDRQYSYGFLVATSAAGLIQYEFKKDILTVTAFNSVLASALPAQLDSDLEKALSQEHRDDLLARRKGIEQYFAE